MSESPYPVDTFKAGDTVVWMQDKAFDGIFDGLKVKVLGHTDKRVKIEVVEYGQPRIKYVRPENLVSVALVRRLPSYWEKEGQIK